MVIPLKLFFVSELSSLKSSLTSADAAKQLEKTEQEVSCTWLLLETILPLENDVIINNIIINASCDPSIVLIVHTTWKPTDKNQIW